MGSNSMEDRRRANQRPEVSKIRRSPSAADEADEIVRRFIPNKHWSPIIKVVAHSIEIAHHAEASKWGLRLNRDSIMLKVGFVEVMQLGDGWFHQLVKRDLVPSSLRSDRRLRFSAAPYANAPDCDFCDTEDISFVARAY